MTEQNKEQNVVVEENNVLEEQFKEAILRRKCIEILDILFATVQYSTFTVSEFFEQLTEKEIPVSLFYEIEKHVSLNNDQKEWVEEAKKSLLPYQYSTSNQVKKIDVGEKVEKVQDKEEVKKEFNKAIKTAKKFVQDNVRKQEEATKEKGVEDATKTGVEIDLSKLTEKVVTPVFDSLIKDESSSIDPAEITFQEMEDGLVEHVDKIDSEPKNPITVDYTVPQDLDTKREINEIVDTVKNLVPEKSIITVSYDGLGMYPVSITKPDGTSNCITIDAKSVLPDYYSVMAASYDNSIAFIPLEHELARKIINDPTYRTTQEDIKDVIDKYCFDNVRLYYTFDFSNIKGLNKLNSENRKKLSEILTKISNTMYNRNYNNVPRFRFEEFNWIDDFVLVSDEKCKSPLAYYGENSAWISGQRITLKDGNISVKLVNQQNARVAS
jgi:hypothetical protein